MSPSVAIAADRVHEVLGRHLLVDGFRLVLDLARSSGSTLVDARDGTEYLDMYTFFASAPLGVNPPELAEDEAFRALLAGVALNKPANPDIYTTHLAQFVDTFERVLGDPALPHLFLVEGGSVAVENALKVAFDWKRRHNAAHGRPPELGTKVMHLRGAFHGRTGYALSLTNTDPAKTALFPTFDWPRLDTPAVRFPLESHRAEVEQAERRALDQARGAFARYRHDIACFIAEPIQGEGDNHLRAEFLKAMEALCREEDALFVLDEVQTGAGLTGTAWAYQQLGLEPDVVVFGKKVQVCGVMGGRRVDDVADNVFRVSSRINSTWGGNLTDMVRSRRMLEVIEAEGLVARAAELGKGLLAGLCELEAELPALVSNARGRGLMCAFDCPDAATRDEVVRRVREEEHVIVLPCGPASVRLRPALSVSEEELARAVAAFGAVLGRMSAAASGQGRQAGADQGQRGASPRSPGRAEVGQ